MPVSPELFQQILSKSKKLCTPEADKAINEKVNARNGFDNDPDPASFESFDDSIFLAESSDSSMEQYDTQINPIIASNSKMPDFIKKSMMEETIDVSSLDPNRSVLDRLPKEAFNELSKKNESVARASRTQAQQIPTTVSQPVDYSIIKAIVEECIDRKLSEYQKKTLDENTVKTIGLKSGKIQLIDNKGRIFSSNLEYIGNVDKSK